MKINKIHFQGVGDEIEWCKGSALAEVRKCSFKYLIWGFALLDSDVTDSKGQVWPSLPSVSYL